MLHNFFHKQRQQRQQQRRKKTTRIAPPQRKIVAVGHTGAFVITADSQVERMPDEFYASPNPRPFLSYAAGADGDLDKRWANDPELYTLKQGRLQEFQREQEVGSHHGGDRIGAEVAAGPNSKQQQHTLKGHPETWKPMTVDDVLARGDAPTSDEGTGSQAGGYDLDGQVAVDIQESYARALVGLHLPPSPPQPDNTALTDVQNKESNQGSNANINDSYSSARRNAGIEQGNENASPRGARGNQFFPDAPGSPSFAIKLLRQIKSGSSGNSLLGASATSIASGLTNSVALSSINPATSLYQNGLHRSMSPASSSSSEHTLEEDFRSPSDIDEDPDENADHNTRAWSQPPQSSMPFENVSQKPSRYHHRKASLLGLKGQTPVRMRMR